MFERLSAATRLKKNPSKESIHNNSHRCSTSNNDLLLSTPSAIEKNSTDICHDSSMYAALKRPQLNKTGLFEQRKFSQPLDDLLFQAICQNFCLKWLEHIRLTGSCVPGIKIYQKIQDPLKNIKYLYDINFLRHFSFLLLTLQHGFSYSTTESCLLLIENFSKTFSPLRETTLSQQEVYQQNLINFHKNIINNQQTENPSNKEKYSHENILAIIQKITSFSNQHKNTSHKEAIAFIRYHKNSNIDYQLSPIELLTVPDNYQEFIPDQKDAMLFDLLLSEERTKHTISPYYLLKTTDLAKKYALCFLYRSISPSKNYALKQTMLYFFNEAENARPEDIAYFLQCIEKNNAQSLFIEDKIFLLEEIKRRHNEMPLDIKNQYFKFITNEFIDIYQNAPQNIKRNKTKRLSRRNRLKTSCSSLNNECIQSFFKELKKTDDILIHDPQIQHQLIKSCLIHNQRRKYKSSKNIFHEIINSHKKNVINSSIKNDILLYIKNIQTIKKDTLNRYIKAIKSTRNSNMSIIHIINASIILGKSFRTYLQDIPEQQKTLLIKSIQNLPIQVIDTQKENIIHALFHENNTRSPYAGIALLQRWVNQPVEQWYAIANNFYTTDHESIENNTFNKRQGIALKIISDFIDKLPVLNEATFIQQIKAHVKSRLLNINNKFKKNSLNHSIETKRLLHQQQEMLEKTEQALFRPCARGDLSIAISEDPVASTLWKNTWQIAHHLASEDQPLNLILYSIESSLSRCIAEDGHRVCINGQKTQAVASLQGYLPHLLLDTCIFPSQLLCILAERFHNSTNNPQKNDIFVFYKQCLEDAYLLYEDEVDPSLTEQFKQHLEEYLKIAYDINAMTSFHGTEDLDL